MPTKFYRVSEAADILEVPYRKLLKLVNDGDFRTIVSATRATI